MALVTYPLNNIEYSAEDAELFHVTRTSGIYANNSFDYSITGADNTIVIGTGIGWIKNGEFSGKVIALKEALSLDMGIPNAVYPRIDAIVIQFDANTNETDIIVKHGTATSFPVVPPIVRTESVYELYLYHVRREPGSLYIVHSNITDLRLNNDYCGLMADPVTSIDTDAIEKQVSELIESLKSKISNVEDGSAYLLRDGSTEMNANLPMGGFNVTGLGKPTNDSDAVSLEYAVQNFAPAGYGLGEASARLVTSLDEVKSPGWYRKWFESAEMPAGAAHGNLVFYVGFYGGTNYLEIIMPANHNYTEYSNLSVLKRRKTEEGWQPWEWEHPPMVAGVTYRTTERIEGRAVFKKRFKTGYVTTGSHNFTHGITSDIISSAINGVLVESWQDAYGCDITKSSATTNLTADLSSVHIETTTPYANGTITVAVY